ncbi:MAG: pseudouridine synthase [Cytophagaceae bacterium]|jgi:tRNA pseudouridine65 synthase|nr:pseudouridine synthase [Cytophagaceae bacterium]
MELPGLEILYEDESVVAVNKPAGLFVHPSDLDRTAGASVMDLLRDQLGHYVYAAHRLDRKTTGVLVFAKTEAADPLLKKSFAEQENSKEYLALCRGFMEEAVRCEAPLKTDRGHWQEACTEFSPLRRWESRRPFGKFTTSRYTLVQARPRTGRTHQIRRHLAHLRHYLIGDTTHGVTKLNAHFYASYQLPQMFLHARSLEFTHPFRPKRIRVEAPVPNWFEQAERLLEAELLPTSTS